MQKRGLLLSAALGLAACASTSVAAISASMASNSTTGIAGITSWPLPYNDTSVVNPSQFGVTENNYGGSALFSMAQSWTSNVNGNLEHIQITITGTAPVNFDVAIYKSTVNNLAETTSQGYTPGANATLLTTSDTDGDLINLVTSDSVTWAQFTQQGATAGVLDIAFSGADSVPILAGQQYVFEIVSDTNPSGMIWFRGGASPVYTGGQAFRQRNPLNGALRDFAMAVSVPEPTSLVAIGAAGLGLLARRRK